MIRREIVESHGAVHPDTFGMVPEFLSTAVTGQYSSIVVVDMDITDRRCSLPVAAARRAALIGYMFRLASRSCIIFVIVGRENNPFERVRPGQERSVPMDAGHLVNMTGGYSWRCYQNCRPGEPGKTKPYPTLEKSRWAGLGTPLRGLMHAFDPANKAPSLDN